MGVCATSGILAHQDVVQLPEQQAKKDFHGEESQLPSKKLIGATVSEVLRMKCRGKDGEPHVCPLSHGTVWLAKKHAMKNKLFHPWRKGAN